MIIIISYELLHKMEGNIENIDLITWCGGQ